MNIDQVIEFYNTIGHAVAKASHDLHEKDPYEPIETVPFLHSDPDRFMAWSLAATCVSPRPTADQIEKALRNASNDDVRQYVNDVHELSMSLFNDNYLR